MRLGRCIGSTNKLPKNQAMTLRSIPSDRGSRAAEFQPLRRVHQRGGRPNPWRRRLAWERREPRCKSRSSGPSMDPLGPVDRRHAHRPPSLAIPDDVRRRKGVRLDPLGLITHRSDPKRQKAPKGAFCSSTMRQWCPLYFLRAAEARRECRLPFLPPLRSLAGSADLAGVPASVAV